MLIFNISNLLKKNSWHNPYTYMILTYLLIADCRYIFRIWSTSFVEQEMTMFTNDKYRHKSLFAEILQHYTIIVLNIGMLRVYTRSRADMWSEEGLIENRDTNATLDRWTWRKVLAMTAFSLEWLTNKNGTHTSGIHS